MRSIRRRLMMGIAATSLGAFLAAGITIFVLARSTLISEFDATTRNKARTLVSLAEFERGRLRLEHSAVSQLPEFARERRGDYFQFWSTDGKTLLKSPNLGTVELTVPAYRYDRPWTAAAVTLSDGTQMRVVALKSAVHIEHAPKGDYERNPTEVTLAVARDPHELNEMIARLGMLLAGVCGIATVLMVAMCALVIRRGLEPVNQLAAGIEGIGEKNLTDRLQADAMPEELVPIVSRLNDLLERLHNAFDREQSFTADAAHELRTPLAGLEAALGVCIKKSRTPEAYAEVVNDCLGVVRNMHGMIDNLMLLARSDAQRLETTQSRVHIGDLIEEAWLPARQIAAQRSLHVSWEIEPDLVMQTDHDKLLHVLTNLFDNAARYTNQGGEVRVSAERDGSSVKILVANTGSHIRAEDAGRVFERFWRADRVRSDAGSHAGLGLSVCQKMIHAIGGEIRVESDAGGEFRISLFL